MTRFMAPRYFDREQLQAVETLLEHLEIGDDEGRRIFIIALEYELAEYDNTSQNNNPPPPLPSPPENFQRVASAALTPPGPARPGFSPDERGAGRDQLPAA